MNLEFRSKNILSLFFSFVILGILPVYGQGPDFIKVDLPDSVSVVNDIYKNKNAEVFVATNNGVYRFFAGIDQFALMYTSEDAGQLKINVVTQGSGDDYFLGTYRSSIIRYNGKDSLMEYSFKDLIGIEALVSEINCIDNTLYVGTSEGNLLVFDVTTNKFSLHASPVDAEINAVWQEEGNALWLSSIHGVFSYDNKQWTQLEDFFQAYGLRIKNDEYWVIGRDAEFNAKLMYLYNYETEVFKKRKQKWATLVFNNLPNNFARFNDIDFDSQGIIWLASNIGVLKYDPFTGYSIWFSKEKYEQFDLKESMRILVIDDQNILVSNQDILYRLSFPIE